MRKILIGILVLFAFIIFADVVHVPGCEFESYTLNSTITIYVHQWMDLDYQWIIGPSYNICDYEQAPENVDLLSFTLDSNAPVTVSAWADWGGLATYITGTIYVTKDGVPFVPTNPIEDGEYLIGVSITSIDPDTPAGDYTVTLRITFQPTVTF
ncbi:MAG: hypothetical protein PWP54_709 [Thermosipho sp. (in: thermotogales)]|nr:hypothetical protein [Thermosipho sp. (in: thermotogales)]